ncbi:MAG: ADP-forming succinate--CoA ligase subunit beta [Chloroflexi bacterium]|nr:ADP-forming succinate--CoA ligase subunit beta [Chloroflexota bacterium]
MKLFEFEAKIILRKYGIATPRGEVARNPDEAGRIAGDIGKPVALKSQVLVSGRGKAGGILFADNAAAAKEKAAAVLGSTIKGTTVGSLLVEERLSIVSELYAAVTIDRQARRYVILASASGGIDIEQAAASAGAISRHSVDPAVDFDEAMAAAMIARLPRIDGCDAARFAAIIATLYKVATDYDAELVEINPLARTSSGELMACDARMIIDDNALFRQTEFENREILEADATPREIEAGKQRLAYVDLDGDIGIVGNGAGLVMATVDLVQYFGGRPANFLDLGGGSSAEVIKKGLLLVMSKPEVRAVLINILGGITRCDIVAQGVIEALQESTNKKPVVVRIMGTNEEEGARMLRQAGVHSYPTMEDAVKQVLKL